MLSEGKTVETTNTTQTEGRKTVHRRTFLKGLGGVAGGVAVLSQTNLARAGNGWTFGYGVEDVPAELQLRMFRLMNRSREWEERMKEEFLAGNDRLYGSFHISIGEEACPVGLCSALNDDDYIASNHRGHHDLIAKGGDIDKMTAEIYFRQTGYNKAYGGSMHITDTSLGILGMNGIIGPQYLFAAGAAYGAKVRGTTQVAVGIGGDGSVNNGWYYAALRNAALYKLPMIAAIWNNGYQVMVPQERTNVLNNLAEIGAGLRIPFEVVDGMDVLAVYNVAKRAVERARAGEGPTIIEAKTYRYYDHSGLGGARPGVLGAFGLPYRSDSEVRAWIAKDPIQTLRRQLIAQGILDEAGADAITQEERDRVSRSVELARAAPLAEPETGLDNVYQGDRVSASQFVA